MGRPWPSCRCTRCAAAGHAGHDAGPGCCTAAHIVGCASAIRNPVFDIRRPLFPRVQVHGINGGRWRWPWAGLCGGLLGSSPPGCVDLSGYGFAAYSITSVTIEQSLASIPSPTKPYLTIPSPFLQTPNAVHPVLHPADPQPLLLVALQQAQVGQPQQHARGRQNYSVVRLGCVLRGCAA